MQARISRRQSRLFLSKSAAPLMVWVVSSLSRRTLSVFAAGQLPCVAAQSQPHSMVSAPFYSRIDWPVKAVPAMLTVDANRLLAISQPIQGLLHGFGGNRQQERHGIHVDPVAQSFFSSPKAPCATAYPRARLTPLPPWSAVAGEPSARRKGHIGSAREVSARMPAFLFRHLRERDSGQMWSR